jgi:antitoxin HicB
MRCGCGGRGCRSLVGGQVGDLPYWLAVSRGYHHRLVSARKNQYGVFIRPLSKDEGRGYLAEYPEIPGCMSDGETIEEAIANGRAALRDCLEVFKESGRRAPKPGVEAAQWRQRLPRTLYLKLTEQAKREGVSINSLVTAMIAEAIGSRRVRAS